MYCVKRSTVDFNECFSSSSKPKARGPGVYCCGLFSSLLEGLLKSAHDKETSLDEQMGLKYTWNRKSN